MVVQRDTAWTPAPKTKQGKEKEEINIRKIHAQTRTTKFVVIVTHVRNCLQWYSLKCFKLGALVYRQCLVVQLRQSQPLGQWTQQHILPHGGQHHFQPQGAEALTDVLDALLHVRADTFLTGRSNSVACKGA